MTLATPLPSVSKKAKMNKWAIFQRLALSHSAGFLKMFLGK
jgi:hypothetical protein